VQVANAIVQKDGIPIYAVGINLPREKGVSPVGLLHDIAAGNEKHTKDVKDWSVLGDVTDEIAKMVCDPKTYIPSPSSPPSPPATTTPAPVRAKKQCSKPVDIVFVMDVSSSIQDLCKQRTAMACWPHCTGYLTCWYVDLCRAVVEMCYFCLCTDYPVST
jgi:hypothetical protein